MMLVVAALTAVITVNAAVAALLPVIVVAATRLGRPASKLLIPLCFGAHAGSQLALTGSNVNLLVSNAAIDYGVPAFGFFEFALVGVPAPGRHDRSSSSCSVTGSCPCARPTASRPTSASMP